MCSLRDYSIFLLITLILFWTPLAVQPINHNEACPVFPQITANPNTVHTQESPMGQRPWVVLIWVSCSSQTITCEGALIDEDWVITTARCLPCGTDASIVVDVGLHYDDIRRDMDRGAGRANQVERVGAYKVYLHPHYNETHIGNDVALIHLIQKVNSSFVISMVECNRKESVRMAGRNSLSAGWGDSPSTSTTDGDQNNTPEIKSMTDVYMGLWSSLSCSRATGVGLHDGVICAGAKLYSNISTTTGHISHSRVSQHQSSSQDNIVSPSSTSCYVQLGASLVVSEPMVMVASNGKQVEIKCEWQLCGILAQGMVCNQPDVPGIYTDVCLYEDWIHDTIRVAEEHILNLEGCPTLPSPPINGYLCGLENVASGQVQFCCERGYQLSGPALSVCDRSKRQWNPNTGRCLPISCPELAVPLHGIANPTNCGNSSYTMGCWFRCSSGYKLKGTELIICQEDGTWSSEVPNCEAIDCGPPPHGGNLLVHYAETTYQSMVSYQCKMCYQLAIGRTKVNRTCESNGKWNGSFPICRLVHCQMLQPPQYGRLIQTSDTCGSEIRFECMDGFVMIGSSRAICLSTGKWSSEAPFCVSAQCPHPVVENSVNFLPPTPDNPPPQNYSYGDRVTIECQPCHRPIRGNVNLTCLQGGAWDGTPPVCEWMTCPLPSLLPNGQIFPLGNLYFCGSRVRFRCYPGYNLIGSSSTYCGDTGKWSNPFPQCRSLNPESECPVFDVENGKVLISHTGVGGVANVSCNQCYSLEGSATLKCTNNLEWDKPLPSCGRRHCPGIRALENGYIIKHSTDSTITCNEVYLFGCDKGYELEGALATTCLYNGKWSHQPPLCKVIKCTLPMDTVNSVVCGVRNASSDGLSKDPFSEDGSGNQPPLLPTIQDQFFLPGSTVEYCCTQGTTPKEGHSLLTCTESGKWDYDPLHCELNGCPMNMADADHPSLILMNASSSQPLTLNETSQLYPRDTVLDWECKDPNLVIYGSSRSVCMSTESNGLAWNRHMPQCINSSCVQTCPSPTVPENGIILSISNNRYSSYGGVSEGTQVVYMCNRQYTLHGSISRRCLVNGVWSGQETMCFKFKRPDSKVIVQHPETKQWQSVSSWHFMTSQQVYLACQTYSGRVVAFRKTEGPPIDTTSVRISEFGDADEKSRQLLMKPMSSKGAMSIKGTYMCEVREGENVLTRTIQVFIHDHFCPFPDVPEQSETVLGLIPGSCHHILCSDASGHQLEDKSKAFRMCLNSGKWSQNLTECVMV